MLLRRFQRSVPIRVGTIYGLLFLKTGLPRRRRKIVSGRVGIQDDNHAVFGGIGRKKTYKRGLMFSVSVVYIRSIVSNLGRSCLSDMG